MRMRLIGEKEVEIMEEDARKKLMEYGREDKPEEKRRLETEDKNRTTQDDEDG